MFDKMIEQSQNALKPLGELASFNAKVLEDATNKQKAFINDIVSDSMAYTKELSVQKDFSGVYQTQKNYLENVQAKWVKATTEGYEILSSAQEKAGEVFKSSVAKAE